MAQSADRLGLLGGTFSPPHIAHLLMAQEAWYRLSLVQAVFVPTARNPLKDDPRDETTDAHRLNMLQLAVGDDARFRVDAVELRQGGVSYSIDTLARYADKYEPDKLFLLMGSDAAVTLPQWKDVELYAGLCTVVVCNRPGEADFSQGLPPELEPLGLRFEFMPLPPLDVSSTEIRRRIRQGKPVRYFVPDSVAGYIHEHGVYR